MLRALGLDTRVFDASFAYRVLYPLHELNKHGWQNITLPYDKLPGSNVNPGDFNLVIFQRLLEPIDGPPSKFRDMVLRIQDRGAKVVLDFDDDYTMKHRQLGHHRLPVEILRAADALTVSTPELRKLMLGYHDKVYAIENLIPPEKFSGCTRTLPYLVIALTGSQSHRFDWPVVYAPLRRILARHSDVRLMCAGWIPDELRDICITPRELGYEGDGVPLSDYGRLIRNIDLVLCPVDPDDGFNNHKTELKAIEAALSARPIAGKVGGAAVVATGGKLPIYHRIVQQGKTGLLVNDHHDGAEWEAAIERMIMDTSFREKCQVAGHNAALRAYNIHTRIGERDRIFREIIRA